MKKSLLIAFLMMATQPMIVDVPHIGIMQSRQIDIPPIQIGARIRRNKGEKKRNKANRWK